MGTLKPHVPNLNDWNADYAYKVTYLGHYKNAAIIEDTTTIIEPLAIDKKPNTNDFLLIYPNPNNGEFQIVCKELIKNLKIFKENGELVLDISDLNSKIYHAQLVLESGTYMVQIITNSNVFTNKKIVVL